MEEKENKKVGANGIVLAILLIATIVIALMWIIICNLNDTKSELQKQIDSAKSETEALKRQVLILESKINGSEKEDKNDNKVSNNIENEIEEDDEEDDDEISNSVDNTVENVPLD